MTESSQRTEDMRGKMSEVMMMILLDTNRKITYLYSLHVFCDEFQRLIAIWICRSRDPYASSRQCHVCMRIASWWSYCEIRILKSHCCILEMHCETYSSTWLSFESANIVFQADTQDNIMISHFLLVPTLSEHRFYKIYTHGKINSQAFTIHCPKGRTSLKLQRNAGNCDGWFRLPAGKLR